MIKVDHINCGALRAFPNDVVPRSIVHCLLLQSGERLILVDCGFGLGEMLNPAGMLSKEAVEFWGIEGNPRYTATAEVQRLGFKPERITDIILTHADVDHVGGLADFQEAQVHISDEEHHAVTSDNPRYVARQFQHHPKFRTYSATTTEWNGLEARKLDIDSVSGLMLVPLFGHTTGHCGVAMKQESGWLLHAGDSYYRRVEIATPDHPVAAMAARFAADNPARLATLDKLRHLSKHNDVSFFSAHDYSEYSSQENPLNVDVLELT